MANSPSKSVGSHNGDLPEPVSFSDLKTKKAAWCVNLVNTVATTVLLSFISIVMNPVPFHPVFSLPVSTFGYLLQMVALTAGPTTGITLVTLTGL